MKNIDQKELDAMILYEDNNWLVFDKPAGIVAHEGNNHWSDLSMNDYLEAKLTPCLISQPLRPSGTSPYQGRQAQEESVGGDIFKPSFGYRLDKDTSGVLIGAKNYEALQYLNQIIRDRKIEKEYVCLVM